MVGPTEGVMDSATSLSIRPPGNWEVPLDSGVMKEESEMQKVL